MRRPRSQTLRPRNRGSQAVNEQSSNTNARLPDLGRLGGLVILGALAIGGLGFFIGLDDGKTPGTAGAPIAPDTTAPQLSDAPLVVSYRELPSAQLRANARFVPDLRQLVEQPVDLFAPIVQTEVDRAKATADRAMRRAYNGSPPVVPHPVDQRSAAACIVCHEHGKRIGDRFAPAMSHAYFTNCTQCHVESIGQPPIADRSLLTESAFRGLERPGTGTRAWAGAPPTMPHPTLMRENCVACHGPTGTAPIRTTHAWRTNCTQCHASNARSDQRKIPPPFLPSVNPQPEASP